MREQKNLIRRPRLKMLTLAVTATLTAFSVAAQTGNITLPDKTLSAREVFDNIVRQTNYQIAANSELTQKLTLKPGKQPVTVKAALDKLFAGSNLTYRVDGNYIIVSQRAPVQAASMVAVNTVRNVAGTVTDGGNILEGVKVQIMGLEGKEAATNVHGRFLIEGVAPGRHVAKLTSADGGSIRFREIAVPTGSDADVKLDLGGALMQAAIQTDTQAAQAISPAKTTAYFVSGTSDNTVRALSDEPKTDMFFVSGSRVAWKQYLPKAGLKTNLLYDATGTLNIAAEFGLARKWTLDVPVAYNPFTLEKGGVNKIAFVQPEVRYWFCQRFEKHFVGLHGIYGQFNIGEVSFLTETFETHRYKGWGAGAGLSYGYHLPMAKRWAWEFTVGAGYVYLEYDKYRCYDCDEYEGRKNRHYFGPTKAGISLVFMIK